MSHSFCVHDDPQVDQWVHTVAAVLGSDRLNELRREHSGLTYGSDCSGIDAPLWAARQILAEKAGLILLTAFQICN